MNNTTLTDIAYKIAAKKLVCAFNELHKVHSKENKIGSKLAKKILAKTNSYIPVIMQLTDYVTDVVEPSKSQVWLDTVVKGAYIYASEMVQGRAKKLPSDLVFSMAEHYWGVEFGDTEIQLNASNLSETEAVEVTRIATIKSKAYLKDNNELFFGVGVIANRYLDADDWATVTARAIFAEYAFREIQRLSQPTK